MQTEVSAVARRVSEPPFTASSVKARVLETVHKLGRSAYRSMVFAARISTDDTVATALDALVRDRYLTIGPGDIYALSDTGYTSIDIVPKEVGGAEYTSGQSKQCRKCRAFKDRYKDFARAPRAPDRRTLDCNECRGVTAPVVVPMIERPAQVAATNEGADPVEAPAVEPAKPAPLILTLPTIMGFYVKIEDGRVYISQPGQECEPLKLCRERGLALGRFLCEHLGGAR